MATKATPTTDPKTISVTVDNFVRAESDSVFAGFCPQGFGKFVHFRELFFLFRRQRPSTTFHELKTAAHRLVNLDES